MSAKLSNSLKRFLRRPCIHLYRHADSHESILEAGTEATFAQGMVARFQIMGDEKRLEESRFNNYLMKLGSPLSPPKLSFSHLILPGVSSCNYSHTWSKSPKFFPYFYRTYAEPARVDKTSELGGVEPQAIDSNSPKSSSASAVSSAEAAMHILQNSNGVLPLDDLKFLFSKLSTAELANALLNLEMAASNYAVDFGKRILLSKAMDFSLIRYPLLWGVKRTAFKHFCAGETLEEASQCLLKMFELGLKGILDFSVEDAHDNETCDKNLENFIKTIKLSTTLPRGAVSFACVKVSALCPLSSLEKASLLLRLKNVNPSIPLPWMFESLPVLSTDTSFFLPPSSSTFSLEAPSPMTKDEENDITACFHRLETITKLCEELGMPLLIDAEYQSIQPIIDHLAYSLALVFNKREYPLVFTTIQAYLRDSKERLAIAMKHAKRANISFGVKLVRGAYLTRETKAANTSGFANPLFPTIQETHDNYDECARIVMESIKYNDDHTLRNNAVVLATHNYSSGCKAVLNAKKLELSKEDNRIHFAQLKGMADTLSLSLLFSGHNVSKYLAYGSVMEVMPYLLRRAEENSSVLSNTLPERVRLRKELWRRFRSLFGLKP